MNPFHNPFRSNLKPRLYNIQSGIVMEENWALPVDQCWLQVLAVFSASHQFTEHTSQLYGFHQGSKKVVLDQTGTRPPNSDLFVVQGWLWEVFWSAFSVRPLSWLSQVVAYSPLFVSSQNPIKK